MLASLSHVERKGDLTRQVKDLPVPQFTHLLDQITNEFEHFLQAIDLINNEALETLLEQILEAFTLKIGQILQADRTTIFLVDDERDELWSKVAQGEGEQSLEIRIPLNAGIAGHVATTGEYLNIPDAYAHPLFNRDVDRQTGYRTRNILCMPIFSKERDQVVAVVQLLNKQAQMPFDGYDEQMFRQFADSIGIILESCNSFYVAARNQKGVHALLRAAACLAQSLDLEKTLQAVMDEARKLMKADRSTLFLLDAEHKQLWSRVAAADGETMIDIRIPADKGIAGYVASTKQPLNIPVAYEDPRFDPSTDKRTGYVTRNILCMPIFNSKGQLIGVTQLINKEKGHFTNSDEEFMRAFNTQAGIALENAQLFESVLQEKQYQKDILESLSDAVISTDMDGLIVTINDSALELLGCPFPEDGSRQQSILWRQRLIGRCVWEVIPIENLQMRLEDSLKTGARHYVPEQALSVGLVVIPPTVDHDCVNPAVHPCADGRVCSLDSAQHVLAVGDRQHPDHYLLWNLPSIDNSTQVSANQVNKLERSVNLTVNPLNNPDGGVRGGLVVLEDISQEKRMKTTMYRYMTPGVAERVMALGDDALMVGERKDVTILFSDIRGYTSLTERLEAADVVSLLNTYFETMVEAVFNHEGTLDKFIGDALMAVFGAPLPLQEHAWMSVQSALDMRRRLAEFNATRPDDMKIKIGIGLSSGEVVSGNIGSQKRMDYTVIGDGVDISSRLEGMTKQYGTTNTHGCDIIMSEFTYAFCKDRIWARELDCIRVKGKTCPISIYELLGDRQTPLNDQTQEFLSVYQNARYAYQQRDFKQAIQLFRQANRLNENDLATLTHIRRSQQYLLNPPSTNWDGVHTMTTK
ncbi:MAG: GAF domain-containing protein [Leptolyngbyaceae bacterium]|nr:GAF domain-containing protein [Leptolyngbyaceae bacterium]